MNTRMQMGMGDRSKRLSRDDKTIKQLSPNNMVAETKNDKPEQRISKAIVPTPIDFDNFLTWVCREWSVPYSVTVVRSNPEVNLELEVKKLLSKHFPESSEGLENKVKVNFRVAETLDFHHHNSNYHSLSSDISDVKQKNVVIIEPHYNAEKQLEIISFVECSNGIPKKVIRAINLCLPFHSKLTRINIRHGRLTNSTLREISKLLPHSNITVLCLDDTIIPQSRFHVLIQNSSQLSYLSLNRCRIDDDVSEQIAINLTFGRGASNSLNVIELASNDITDSGAEYLGNMLRTNRRLVHLNLADNKITDKGGLALIAPLMEFTLSCQEVLDMKSRRYENLKRKQATIKTSTDPATDVNEVSPASNISIHTPLKGAPSKLKSPRARKSLSKETPKCVTTSTSHDILHPYTATHLALRNGRYIAKGNFILCSLNLAYNDLRYPFVKKLEDVLQYQYHTLKIMPDTGLIRIILDGNDIPQGCSELNQIALFLRFNIDQRQPKEIVKRRQSSTLSKKSLVKSQGKIK